MKPKVAIVCECLSANLGDQAIARSLSNIMSSYYDVKLVSFGRLPVTRLQKDDQVAADRLSVKRRIGRLLPNAIKSRIKWYVLGGRRVYESYFGNAINDCELVIVGGGQLIKNNVALFSDRIDSVWRITRRNRVSLSFVGVGVDRSMKPLNWRLVQRALQQSEQILVRDDSSRHRIEANVKIAVPCSVVPDLVFGLANPHAEPKFDQRRYSYALNIMSLRIMLSDDASEFVSGMESSYCDLAAQIIAADMNCILFTSGSAEDLQEMQRMHGVIKDRVGLDLEVFHPGDLDDLMSFLGIVKNVVASRLHAGILSFVSGCNLVCINWDDKVAGVWAVVGQADRVIEVSGFSDTIWAKAILSKLNVLKAPSQTELKDLADTVWNEVTLQIIGSRALQLPDQSK